MRKLLGLLALLPVGLPANTIEFQLDEKSRVSLGIYDPRSGQLVRTLLNAEPLAGGNHKLSWDGFDHRAR